MELELADEDDKIPSVPTRCMHHAVPLLTWLSF